MNIITFGCHKSLFICLAHRSFESARSLNLEEVRTFCSRVDAVPCQINDASVLKVVSRLFLFLLL